MVAVIKRPREEKKNKRLFFGWCFQIVQSCEWKIDKAIAYCYHIELLLESKFRTKTWLSRRIYH